MSVDVLWASRLEAVFDCSGNYLVLYAGGDKGRLFVISGRRFSFLHEIIHILKL